MRWDGRLDGADAGPGAYELRVRAVSDGGVTTETAVPFVLQHYTVRGTPMMRWSPAAPGDLRRADVRQAGQNQPAPDARPDIALAIRLYDNFDIERAVPLLRAVVQRHEDYPRDQTARAFLYLGTAYAIFANRDSSRMFLRQALRRDPELTLDPRKFSATELAALDSARSAGLIAGLLPIEIAAPVPGDRYAYFTAYASRPARVSVALRATSRSDRRVIFEADSVGTIPVLWNGMLGDAPIPEGRYEVLVTATAPDGQRDSTSAYFSVRHESFGGTSRSQLTLLLAPSP
jgi:hypothetical protein